MRSRPIHLVRQPDRPAAAGAKYNVGPGGREAPLPAATICLRAMATPEGLEPSTFSLEGCCSIRLSYGAVGLVPADGFWRSDRAGLPIADPAGGGPRRNRGLRWRAAVFRVALV